MLILGHGPRHLRRRAGGAVLCDGAEVLESLVRQTLALMNEERSLDEILHAVSAPAELLGKPYLLPKYDDPEFVVRGIWHLYAGWRLRIRPPMPPPPEARD